MKSNQRQSFIRGALFSYLGPRVQPMSISWERLPTDLAHLEQGVRRACRGNLLANDELTDLPDFLVQLQSLLDEQDEEGNMNGNDQETDPGSMSPENICQMVAEAMSNMDAAEKNDLLDGLRHLLRAGAASDTDQPALRPGDPVVTTTIPVKAKDRRPAMDSSGFNQRWGSQLRGVKVGSGMLRPA